MIHLNLLKDFRRKKINAHFVFFYFEDFSSDSLVRFIHWKTFIGELKSSYLLNVLNPSFSLLKLRYVTCISTIGPLGAVASSIGPELIVERVIAYCELNCETHNKLKAWLVCLLNLIFH